MGIRPGELIIDDSNFKQFCLDPVVSGQQMTRGLNPRDFKAEPAGCHALIPKASIPKIPRSEWSARIRELEEKRALLSDMRMTGKFGSMIPSLDQNGRGYCWAHSTVSCALLLRAKDNQPFVSLSAYAIACIIKNFRDEGGWNAQSVKFMIERGCPSDQFWPQRSVSRANDNANTWTNAALHKVIEYADDVDEGDFDTQMTYALNLIPGPLDLNWWSHSICQCDPVEIEPGSFGVRIWNSWGDSWEQNGMAVLRESKARNNGFIALRTGSIATV